MDQKLVLITIACTVQAMLLIEINRRRNPQKHKRWQNRRYWVRPLLRMRKELGFYAGVFPMMKNDPEMFFKYTRMDVQTFHLLLTLVGPSLMKWSKREPLYSEERLLITLRYLATGCNPFTIGIHHLIAESTVYSVIKEVSAAISNILAPIYLSQPTEEEWREISQGFWKKWNMPNCLGSIDGKHVEIKAPPNSGSQFFNYKKTFSIVLMAVCDYNYRFTLHDVGAYGGESDGGIFNRSLFGQAFQNEELNFPRDNALLPGSGIATPFYIVGDEAFPISRRMMRPYPARTLNLSRRIFNYRLSRARRVIENTFGILAARWGILQTKIGLNATNVDRIVMATVTLHNFLMTENEKRHPTQRRYCPANFIDEENDIVKITEGHWRAQNQPFTPLSAMNPTASTKEGLKIRESLEQYFMTPEGEVPWQLEYVSLGQHQDELVPF